MRAASDFTQARARFNITANNGYAANTFQIEIWDKTNSVWAVDAPSGTMSLAQGDSFGYGTQTNPPPPSTQTAIGLWSDRRLHLDHTVSKFLNPHNQAT